MPTGFAGRALCRVATCRLAPQGKARHVPLPKNFVAIVTSAASGPSCAFAAFCALQATPLPGAAQNGPMRTVGAARGAVRFPATIKQRPSRQFLHRRCAENVQRCIFPVFLMCRRCTSLAENCTVRFPDGSTLSYVKLAVSDFAPVNLAGRFSDCLIFRLSGAAPPALNRSRPPSIAQSLSQY